MFYLCYSFVTTYFEKITHLEKIFRSAVKDHWTLDRREAPIENRKAELSIMHSMIR